eukprot:3646664-Amphidinium_carterae.1
MRRKLDTQPFPHRVLESESDTKQKWMRAITKEIDAIHANGRADVLTETQQTLERESMLASAMGTSRFGLVHCQARSTQESASLHHGAGVERSSVIKQRLT